MTTPRGLGMFLASGDRAVDRVAADVAACGAKWAAVFVEAPDGRRAPFTRLDAFPSALEHHGITPLCWTFPHPQTWRDAIIHLRAVWRRERWGGPPIIDIETAPDGERWNIGEIYEMMLAAHDMNPLVTLWDRAYALGLHGTETVLFQAYRRAANDPKLEQDVRWWKSRGHEVVPVIGTHVGNADRLRADLQNATFDDLGNARSVGVWCVGTTSALEREVLREGSDRINTSP